MSNTVRIDKHQLSSHKPIPYNTSNLNHYAAVQNHGPSLKPEKLTQQRQSRFETITQPHLHNQSLALYNYADPSQMHFYSQEFSNKKVNKKPQSAQKAPPSASKVVKEFDVRAKFAQRQLNAFYQTKAEFEKSQQLENSPPKSYLQRQLTDMYTRQNQSPLRTKCCQQRACIHTNKNASPLKTSNLNYTQLRNSEDQSLPHKTTACQSATFNQSSSHRQSSPFDYNSQLLGRPNRLQQNNTFSLAVKEQNIQRESLTGYNYTKSDIQSDQYRQREQHVSAEKVFVRRLAQDKCTLDIKSPTVAIPSPTKKKNNHKVQTARRSEHYFSKEEMERGPGTYRDEVKFGENSRSVSIIGGRRAEAKSEVPGPGYYLVDDKLTKPTSVECTIRGDKRSRTPVDSGLAPGQYEEHRQFGQDLRPVSIGRKYQEKVIKTIGPGEYEIDRADGITMASSHVVTIRPISPNKQTKQEDNNLGPGYYETIKPFGVDARSQEFGRRYEEKLVKGPGPGFYSPERADSLTRSKVVSTDFVKQTGRIEREADPKNGPGTYDLKNNFGDDLNPMTIGRKPQAEPHDDKIGPGHYSPDSLAIKKSTQAVDFAKQKGREQKEVITHLGPGIYDTGDSFGKDVTGGTIGMKHPEKQVPAYLRQLGPGYYQTELADSVIKQSVPKIDFQNQTGREDQQTNITALGPGHYQLKNEFGDNTKPISIGTRPKSKSPSKELGPGTYNISQGELLIKPQPQTVDFSKQIKRIEPDINPNNGPGSYHHPHGEQNDWIAKQMRIRTKSRSRSPDADEMKRGPGCYSTELSEQLVRSRALCVDFSNQIGRQEKEPDPKNGPGTYSQKEFGHDLRDMKIGEKRHQKAEQSVGPGHYEPLDTQVKLTAPAVSFQKRTGRSDVRSESPSQLGPGAYHIEEDFGSNLNRMTIGEKRPQKIEDSILAAPGRYDVDSSLVKQSARQVNFAQLSERFVDKNVQLPGPGDYQIQREFGSDAQKVTIGAKHREASPNPGCGPGSYSPERAINLTKPQAPVVEFQNLTGKKEPKRESELGPGTYNYDKQFGADGQSVTILERRAAKVQTNEVGPCDYNPNDLVTRPTNKTADFSKTTARKDQQANCLLGPGYYETQIEFGKDSKSITIGERREEKIDNNLPGPGSYTINDSFTKRAVASIDFSSTMERQVPTVDPDIGPGSYDYTQKFGSDCKQMTIGERRPDKVTTDVPEPGQYDPTTTLVKKSSLAVDFTLNSGRKDPKEDLIPGPGHYNNSTEFTSNMRPMTIGEKREFKSPENKLGPGYYNINESQTKQRQTVTDFGAQSDRFIDKIDSELGPGYYDETKQFGSDSKSMTIGERRLNMVISDNPAPGQYCPSTKLVQQTAQAVDFSNLSSRKEPRPDFLPGPGFYDSQTKLTDNMKQMTIGERRPDSFTSDNPAPGQYNPVDTFVKKNSQAIDFGNVSGRKEPRPDFVPGPGFYDSQLQLTDNMKQMTIGERRPENFTEDNPAPGQYDPVDKLVTTSSMAVDFSLYSGRKVPTGDLIPGPGYYSLQTDFTNNLKPITIGEKREFKSPENRLGPGQYNINESQTKHKSPSADFRAQSYRWAIQNHENQESVSQKTYTDSGSRVNTMTIGEHLPSKITEESPSAGDYSPVTTLVKPSSKAFDFSKTKGRSIEQRESSPEPDQYSPEKADRVVYKRPDAQGERTLSYSPNKQEHSTVVHSSKPYKFSVTNKKTTPSYTQQLIVKKDYDRHALSYNHLKQKYLSQTARQQKAQLPVIYEKQELSPILESKQGSQIKKYGQVRDTRKC